MAVGNVCHAFLAPWLGERAAPTWRRAARSRGDACRAFSETLNPPRETQTRITTDTAAARRPHRPRSPTRPHPLTPCGWRRCSHRPRLTGTVPRARRWVIAPTSRPPAGAAALASQPEARVADTRAPSLWADAGSIKIAGPQPRAARLRAAFRRASIRVLPRRCGDPASAVPTTVVIVLVPAPSASSSGRAAK